MEQDPFLEMDYREKCSTASSEEQRHHSSRKRTCFDLAKGAVLTLALLYLVSHSQFLMGTLREGFSNAKTCMHPRPTVMTIEDRVRTILTKNPLIGTHEAQPVRTRPQLIRLVDGHNDLPILIRFLYNNHIYESNFSEPFSQGGLPMHVDLPRLRTGMQGGAFWSVFTPCPANGSDFSNENYAASKRALQFSASI